MQVPTKQDVEIPVDFLPDLVRKYETVNKKYVPSLPVKMDEAKLIMKILPLDIRCLLGCGLKWDGNDILPDQSSASGSASDSAAPAAPPAEATDRSPSPTQAPDPLNFTSWDPTDLGTIPCDQLVFSTEEFTNNRTCHAAAMLFFLHPELPLNCPQLDGHLQASHELR
jgi:hypothetical protein